MGWRAPDYRLDLDEVDRVLRESGPVITFVCSPNNPTGRAETPETVAAVLGTRARAWWWWTRPTGSSRRGARWSSGDGPGSERLAVVRTFSKTWSMAACRLGYLVADPEVVAACDMVALPYHLDAMTQLAGRLALRHVGGHGAAGGPARPRNGAASPAPWPPWTSSRGRRMPTSSFSGPCAGPAADVWADLLASSVLVRDCSTWPGLDGCLRVTVGTPAENDRFLAALGAALEEG